MDSTLVDFTDMKWQRGDLTFIFNGDARGNLLQQHFSHWIYVYIFLKFSTSKEKSRGYSAYSYSRTGSIKHVLRLPFVEWELVLVSQLLLYYYYFSIGKQAFAVLDNEKKVFQRLRTEVSGVTAHMYVHIHCDNDFRKELCYCKHVICINNVLF